MTGVPKVEILEKRGNGIGSSSGPNLWSFTGYKASLVLSQVSDDVVVEVVEEKDKLINFYYHFPDLTKEEAKDLAIRAISKALRCVVDTSEVVLPVYEISCSEVGTSKSTEEAMTGAKLLVENGRATTYGITLFEVEELLNKHRHERFSAVRDDSCLVSVDIDLGASIVALTDSLYAQSGIKIVRKPTSVRKLVFK